MLSLVDIKLSEIDIVGSWVYKYFDEVSGISFLPYTDHIYKQAPYQDIERKEYLELRKDMPTTIDFGELVKYESEDNTTGSQELACTGGVCELVDVTAPQED